MSDNDAHAPQWKRLYKAAIFELDPAKSIQRIAEARSAVLDRIEEGFSKASEGEASLGYALHMLTTCGILQSAKLASKKRLGPKLRSVRKKEDLQPHVRVAFRRSDASFGKNAPRPG